MNQRTTQKLLFTMVLGLGFAIGCNNESKNSPPPGAPPAQPAPGPAPQKGQQPEGQSPLEVPIDQLTGEVVKDSMYSSTGGKMLRAYLAGTNPTIVDDIFKNPRQAYPLMSQMSMTIQELKNQNQYPEESHQKVQALNLAITQTLHDRRVHDERLRFGTRLAVAVGTGALAGYYGDEVSGWAQKVAKRVRTMPIVDGPINAVSKAFERTKEGPAQIKEWFAGKREQLAETGPGRKVKENYRALRDQARGLWRSRGGSLPGDKIIAEDITDIMVRLDPKFDATALRIDPVVVDEERAQVANLTFVETGKGFDAAVDESTQRLVAKATGRGGETEYYWVQNQQVLDAARTGDLLSRRKAFAQDFMAKVKTYKDNTVTFFTETGEKIKSGITKRQAYKFITENPKMLDAEKRLGVGAAVAVPTYLVMGPITRPFFSLEDYVHQLGGTVDLEKDFPPYDELNDQPVAAPAQ